MLYVQTTRESRVPVTCCGSKTPLLWRSQSNFPINLPTKKRLQFVRKDGNSQYTPSPLLLPRVPFQPPLVLNGGYLWCRAPTRPPFPVFARPRRRFRSARHAPDAPGHPTRRRAVLALLVPSAAAGAAFGQGGLRDQSLELLLGVDLLRRQRQEWFRLASCCRRNSNREGSRKQETDGGGGWRGGGEVYSLSYTAVVVPPNPYNAGTERVGFSWTRQASLATSAKRREVFGEMKGDLHPTENRL